MSEPSPELPDATAATEFDATVERSHRALTGLAYAICGDGEHARDAFADACARVWPRWQRGDVVDLSAYLRRAVVHAALGRRRRRATEQRFLARRSVVPRERPFADEVAEREWIWAALQAMPARHRAVLVLRHFEDLSEQETADVLGIAVGTVKSRNQRALERLRRLLDERGEP